MVRDPDTFSARKGRQKAVAIKERRAFLADDETDLPVDGQTEGSRDSAFCRILLREILFERPTSCASISGCRASCRIRWAAGAHC